MDPVTIGVIGLASSVLSAGIGAAGAIQQGQAAAASMRYQAQVAQNNQIIAEQNARYASQAGQVNAQAQDFRTRAIIGQEEAAQGASGIDLTTGSPKAVVEGTRQLGRLDTANIIQQANLTSYGYKTQSSSFGATSGLERQGAGFATAAGAIGAESSILGGASQFASKWLQFQNAGIFNNPVGVVNNIVAGGP